MTFRRVLFCAFCVSFLNVFGGCEKGSQPVADENVQDVVPISNELKRIAEADPAIDLRSAIATNDLRLIGVYGYTLDVPGVTNFHEKFESTLGVKVIPGTSDMISSPEQAELQRAAKRYASKYNDLLLRFLQENPGLTNKAKRSGSNP